MLKTHRRRFMLGAAFVAVTGFTSLSAASAADIELSVAIWDPAQMAGVQLAIDAFEAANPNISITLEQSPPDQYYTRLDAALGARQGPDVMWQSSRASFYIDGGALHPLDEFITADSFSLEGYNQTIASLYNINGKQYGIPKDFDAWTFVYNASLFEELGVTPPSAGWTWEDMVAIATEIKEKRTSDDTIPLYYNFSWNNGVASLAHSMGGAMVADGKAVFNSEHGIKALEMVKSLQDDGLIVPVADSGDLNPVNALVSGTLAMSVIPSWNLSLLARADVPDGTFHVLHLPAVNGAWRTDTNGLSYVMNTNSKHKEEAWELIKFLTSDEGAVLHAEGGAGLPANLASEPLAAFVAANEGLVGLEDALAAQQPYLRTTTANPKVLIGARKLSNTVMTDFYAGRITAQEAAQMIDEINAESLSQ